MKFCDFGRFVFFSLHQMSSFFRIIRSSTSCNIVWSFWQQPWFRHLRSSASCGEVDWAQFNYLHYSASAWGASSRRWILSSAEVGFTSTPTILCMSPRCRSCCLRSLLATLMLPCIVRDAIISSPRWRLAVTTKRRGDSGKFNKNKKK